MHFSPLSFLALTIFPAFFITLFFSRSSYTYFSFPYFPILSVVHIQPLQNFHSCLASFFLFSPPPAIPRQPSSLCLLFVSSVPLPSSMRSLQVCFDSSFSRLRNEMTSLSLLMAESRCLLSLEPHCPDFRLSSSFTPLKDEMTAISLFPMVNSHCLLLVHPHCPPRLSEPRFSGFRCAWKLPQGVYRVPDY